MADHPRRRVTDGARPRAVVSGVAGFLGSPRAFRRFSLDFDENVRKVPFKVRIEVGADGKRYVKEGEI